MNEIMAIACPERDTYIKQEPGYLSASTEVNYKLLNVLKTEDANETSTDLFTSRGDCSNDYNECNITDVMKSAENVKDNKENIEDKPSCQRSGVEEAEDVKYSITTDVASSEVCCGTENIQRTAESDGSWKKVGLDEDREYSASDAIKYESFIKEEKIDIEDVDTDIEGYADNKDLKLFENTCRNNDQSSKSVQWYQCKFCDYKVNRKHTLWTHFRVRHDENAEWYHCQLCEYKTKTKESLTRHSLLQHSTSVEWYQCKFCEFRTKYKRGLEDHFRGKHDSSAEWHECHLCEFKTKTKSSLSKHSREKHTLSSEPRYRHHCQLCEYKTKYKTHLKRHIDYKHNQDGEYHHCQQCTFKTKYKECLESHFKYKHDNAVEWYHCKFCEFKTKYKTSLKLHFQTKHENNEDIERIHCQHCSYKTKLKRNLKRHLAVKHDSIC